MGEPRSRTARGPRREGEKPQWAGAGSGKEGREAGPGKRRGHNPIGGGAWWEAGPGQGRRRDQSPVGGGADLRGVAKRELNPVWPRQRDCDGRDHTET